MSDDARPGAVLPGPFLTRREAARCAGLTAGGLAAMTGAVRISGPLCLEEVYPQFQFDPAGGVVAGLPDVVAELAPVLAGRALVAWLLAAREELNGSSALGWLTAGGRVEAVHELALQAALPPRRLAHSSASASSSPGRT